MRISCGVCHELLKDDDLLTLDFMNKISHYTCLGADVIIDIDTYKNIKEKYWFFREELLQ